jgi:hypothetical protein
MPARAAFPGRLLGVVCFQDLVEVHAAEIPASRADV